MMCDESRPIKGFFNAQLHSGYVISFDFCASHMIMFSDGRCT